MNTPFSSVESVRLKLVCTSRTVTTTPLTGLPFGSDTTPRMIPVVACDCALSAAGTPNTKSAAPSTAAARRGMDTVMALRSPGGCVQGRARISTGTLGAQAGVEVGQG